MKTVKLLLLAIFCITAAVFAESSKEDLPTESDMEILQKQTSSTWGRFERKAFVPLLDYYFNSGFTDDSKQQLLEICERYENLLKNIHSRQVNEKDKIEKYHGEDWDLLFGKNTLWRNYDSLAEQTSFLIAKCLYYRALASEPPRQAQIVEKVFTRCETITGGVNALYRKLLEAQCYMLIRQSREDSYDRIFERLEDIGNKMTAETELYYKMWLCRLELLKPFSESQLNRIIDNFLNSPQRDNILPAMRLAFLQLSIGQSSLLESNVERWQQAGKIVAGMLYNNAEKQLADENAAEYISSLTHYEKQLLALRSLKQKNHELDPVIASFGIGEQKADRVLSYAAAVKYIGTEPKTAFKAANAALQKPPEKAKIFAHITDLEITATAVKAGYALLEDDNYTEDVVEAFYRYEELAGEEAEPKLVYSYAVRMLKVRRQKAKQLLEQIYQDGGELADKALFELLAAKFADEQDISERIGDLYQRCAKGEDKTLLQNVTDLYSRHLASVQELAKALSLLRAGYDKEWVFRIECGLYVVGKFLEKAEFYINRDGEKTIENAMVVADKIKYDEQKNPSVRLVFIETAVLADWDKADIGQMPEYKDGYGTLEYYRAEARYLRHTEKYYDAAFVWSKIAKALASLETVPLWRWQRAKYYQLANSKRSEKVSDKQLLHSINVLEASSRWQQGYWMEELNKLKPAEPVSEPPAANSTGETNSKQPNNEQSD